MIKALEGDRWKKQETTEQGGKTADRKERGKGDREEGKGTKDEEESGKEKMGSGS